VSSTGKVPDMPLSPIALEEKKIKTNFNYSNNLNSTSNSKRRYSQGEAE
jgi:hypothetical protein